MSLTGKLHNIEPNFYRQISWLDFCQIVIFDKNWFKIKFNGYNQIWHDFSQSSILAIYKIISTRW